MTEVFLAIALVGGLTGLVVSADKLVGAAQALGLGAGVSPIVVGAVVIGFGTSLPEAVVSAMAIAAGDPDVAVGNVVGSNLANVLLVLGAAALLAPAPISRSVARRELPLSFATVVLFAIAMQWVSFTAAALLAIAGAGALWVVMTGGADEVAAEGGLRLGDAAVALAALAALVVTSHVALESALGLAEAFGLSSGLVGAVILAVGTSLPELAAAVSAARRGAHGLIVGTLLGSNIMNSTVVGSLIVALSAHAGVGPSRAYATIAVATMVAGVAIATSFMWTGRVSRPAGGVLLSSYGAAVAVLVVFT